MTVIAMVFARRRFRVIILQPMTISSILAAPMTNGLMAVMPLVLRFPPVTTRLVGRPQLEPDNLLAVPGIIVLAVAKLLAVRIRNGPMVPMPLVLM